MEKPAANTMPVATCSGGFPAAPCANTGAAIKPTNNNKKKIPASFFTLLLLCMKRRQEVVPVILKQPGSRWSAIKPN
jgi:hypothetical protein